MSLIHNNVFDAALDHISSNSNKAEVRTSASSLLASTSVDAGNFGSNASWSSGSSTGRALTCLTSSASDMKSISVTTGGSAQKVALVNTSSSADLVIASISSAPVNLGSSDKVNLSTFSTILKDPV